MSQLIEPIFDIDIHDMDDIIDVINSDSEHSVMVKGPLAEIMEADPVTTFMGFEESGSLVAGGNNSEKPTEGDQVPDSLEYQRQRVMSRTQRRDAHRRASLRLDIPSLGSQESGGQVASRFAPSVPKAAPRISSMYYLTKNPELRIRAMDNTVSETVQNADEAAEQFCLLMKVTDDIGQLLFKLRVNQELMTALLLKPLDRTNQLAIETRAGFRKSLYHRVGELVRQLVQQNNWRDRQERERIAKFSLLPKSDGGKQSKDDRSLLD